MQRGGERSEYGGLQSAGPCRIVHSDRGNMRDDSSRLDYMLQRQLPGYDLLRPAGLRSRASRTGTAAGLRAARAGSAVKGAQGRVPVSANFEPGTYTGGYEARKEREKMKPIQDRISSVVHNVLLHPSS